MESSKGQNTRRGGSEESGPRRGAWKNKSGYSGKPTFEDYPEEGLHPAGSSRNWDALGTGTEVLARTVNQETKFEENYQVLSHCPGNQEPASTKRIHTP